LTGFNTIYYDFLIILSTLAMFGMMCQQESQIALCINVQQDRLPWTWTKY